METALTSSYWQSALSGNPTQISELEPQEGFYQIKSAQGRIPVQVSRMPKSGIAVYADGKKVAKVKASEIWIAAARNPITPEAYRHRMTHGVWHDEIVTKHTDIRGQGHNAPPDPFSRIFGEIKDLTEQARAFLDANKGGLINKQLADRAAGYRDRLNLLGKEAEAERVKEKKPHDDAAKAVQAKWKPAGDEVDGCTTVLKKAIAAYLLAEERRAQEAAEKARAEERTRREAEAARLAEQVGEQPPEIDEPPMPDAPPPKALVGGSYASRTGLRTKTIAIITDAAKLWANPMVQNHPIMKEALQKVAEALVLKGGIEVEGVTKKEERVL